MTLEAAGSGAGISDGVAIVTGIVLMVLAISLLPMLRRSWVRTEWVGPVKGEWPDKWPGSDLTGFLFVALLGSGTFLAGVLPRGSEEPVVLALGAAAFIMLVLTIPTGRWGTPRFLVPPAYRAPKDGNQPIQHKAPDSDQD